VNQCDGCRRGLAVERGIHLGEDGPYMACTRVRYDGDGAILFRGTFRFRADAGEFPALMVREDGDE
jgi:hypothetical protein